MRTLLYIVAFFLLQSCKSYQYLTIASPAITSENELYVHRLEYRFNSRNLPINLTIENKTAQPIYIDWSKSAAIVNDFHLSYVPNSTFSGSCVTVTNHSWERSIATSVVGGSITNNPNISFILRVAKMQKTTLRLYDGTYNSGRSIAIQLDPNREYSVNDTGLRFRNYLTLYLDEEMEKVDVVDHAFFCSTYSAK
jgi:hypothetical protein